MSSLLFPAISEVVRENPENLKNIYYKMRQYIDWLSAFVVGVLASFSDLIVNILYDDRYSDAGWMLKILVVPMLFVGTKLADSCFLALGYSRLVMMLGLMSAIFLLVMTPAMYSYYGIVGALYAIAASSLIKIPVVFVKMSNQNIFSFKKEFLHVPFFVLIYYICEALQDLSQ